MKTSVLNHVEQLAALNSWSELAAECGATPFSCPSYVVPSARELGTGLVCSVAVEEEDQLVGLMLTYEAPVLPGTWEARFIGTGYREVHESLVAEQRGDVAQALWEVVLGNDRRQLRLSDIAVGRSLPSPAQRDHSGHDRPPPPPQTTSTGTATSSASSIPATSSR